MFILLHVACPVLPASLIEEAVFSPLYILACFVKDKASTGVWVYIWAFCLVPLVYISVFVPVLCCLDDCNFVVWSEVRKLDFFQLHSSFSRLLWLIGVFCISVPLFLTAEK